MAGNAAATMSAAKMAQGLMHPNPFLRPKQFDSYYEREMAEQSAAHLDVTNKLLMSNIGMGIKDIVRGANAK